MGTQYIKSYLVPNLPVEIFHWFFRKNEYEFALTVDKVLIFNRYNFSSTSNVSLSEQALNPILSDAKFFMNGQTQLGFLESSRRDSIETSYYFKYIESLTSKLSSPVRNVYTYSFALNARDDMLSGAMDFSKMVADKTFIDVSILAAAAAKLTEYNMHMYYKGLVTLTFKDGFMQTF